MPPPSPHFWYQNSTFEPTWECNMQSSSQGSRLQFEDEENNYNKKLKGRARQLHATVQSAYLLDHYQLPRPPAAYHAQEGTDALPPPRQPSRHTRLRGPELEEGQCATRPMQKVCHSKVQRHHSLPAATLLGCHSGPEEGCQTSSILGYAGPSWQCCLSSLAPPTGPAPSHHAARPPADFLASTPLQPPARCNPFLLFIWFRLLAGCLL
jgi:hypothetical protein